MKGLVIKSIVTAAVLAVSMALVACDQKPSSSTTGGGTGGTTAPAGGAKSLAGKSVESAKNVVNKVNATQAAESAAAENAGDVAKGAWADLRTAAAAEADKQLATIKAKLKDLQVSNPALFTSLNEAVKTVEGKIGELKTAGADTWQALANQVKAAIADIQKRIGT